MFEVSSEFVEHTVTAVCNINRCVWGTETTDQPAWMRATNIACTMTDTGIGPAVQHMDAFIQLLMATLGPREGAYLGQAIIAYQVRMALQTINAHTDIQYSPATNAMVELLNAAEGNVLHVATIDVDMPEIGACAMHDEYHVRCIPRGHFHLAYSGMQCIGKTTPNTGYRGAFQAMEEDLGFRLPGIDAHAQGGAGPRQRLKALKQRCRKNEDTCLGIMPPLNKIPLHG